MIGPVRLRKKTEAQVNNSALKLAQLTAFFAIENVDRVSSIFNLGSPVQPETPQKEETFLKLNIGGSDFQFKYSSLKKSQNKSMLLSRFATLNHKQRLNICDEYDGKNNSYFFERSWQLFDSIYRYLSTGKCHRPMGVCADEFLEELLFWGVNPLEECHWIRNKRPAAVSKAALKLAKLSAYFAIEKVDRVSSVFQFGPEIPQTEEEETFLKLNIGGSDFQFKYSSLKSSQNKCLLLSRFATLNHKQRLNICDEYDVKNNSYFFERSWQLFDSIYRYLSTGKCHRPMGNADQWQAEFAACCWPDCKKDSDKKKTPKIQDFRTVHFGPFRETVWETLEDPGSSLLARFINIFSIILVIISNINLVLGTISYFQTQPDNAPHPVLDHIELVCMVWFTFEYALKIAVSADKTAALFNPMNLVDLTAIMPFYIELFLQTSGLSASFRNINSAMLALKILRSLRICRILKLGKYSGGVQMFARTIINSSSQLMMLSLVIFTGMMFFSTVIYFIEHDEFESQFYSIPAAFWWCVATMSTAGYGDLVPKTIAGKMVAMGAAMCGILVLVIPISIVAENWMEIGEQTEQNQVQEMHEAILARAHSVRRNALVRQKWPKWKRNLLD